MDAEQKRAINKFIQETIFDKVANTLSYFAEVRQAYLGDSFYFREIDKHITPNKSLEIKLNPIIPKDSQTYEIADLIIKAITDNIKDFNKDKTKIVFDMFCVDEENSKLLIRYGYKNI